MKANGQKRKTGERELHMKDLHLSKRAALAVASGLMVPLCFPPFGWWPILLLVLPPLLIATTHTTPRRAFYLGLLQGIIGYGGSLYWLYNIFAYAAIPLFVIMAAFVALFCLLYNSLAEQIKSPALRTAIVAVLWTGIEFYRSELFLLRFPWITPGSGLGPTWLVPVVGVYGSSFLIAAAAAALVQRRTRRVGLLLSLGVLALGAFRPGTIAPPDDDSGLTVTVVQNEECFLPVYVKLTRDALEANPDLVIWPEYALPYNMRVSTKQMATLTDLCAEMDAILVVGTKTIVGGGLKDWRNTALTLDRSGILGEYYKMRPVHFFNDGIPGTSYDPIETELGRFVTPICFDCDYSEVARRMVARGAEFIAAPSFDSESWSASQHLQHAAFFRLRAVETGRWLASAASSGVSQIIDPNGNVHRSLPPMESGILTYRIGRISNMTLFVLGGWMFPWFCLAGAGCMTAYVGVKAGFGRRRQEPRK
jgi:apolipoprotein N-acyltransferase